MLKKFSISSILLASYLANAQVPYVPLALNPTNHQVIAPSDFKTANTLVDTAALNAALLALPSATNNPQTLTYSNTFFPESFYLSAGAVPMLGWHSWNTQNRTNLWASNIVAAVDGLYTNGLVNYGWNWVEADDNIFTSTNAQGLLIPDSVHWANHPSNVIAYAHSRGIKFMLYSELGKFTDGMSVATNPDGSYIWPSFGTQNKFVENGLQFAKWGIDGVWTHGDWTSESTAEQSYKRMIDYYRAISTNRPVHFLSINSKPNAWSTGGDILRPENSANWSCWYPMSGLSQDMASDLITVMERMVDQAALPQVSRTIRPGHTVTFGVYPLLPSWVKIGFGGAALFSSPILLTTLPTDFNLLSATIQKTLTNVDFLAIHQDKAVIPGFKVLDMPVTSYDWIKNGDIPTNPNATNILSAVTNSVWLKPLFNPGSYAVFLFNRGSNAANIYFNRTNLPIAQVNYAMFDVFQQTNMVNLTNQTITMNVQSNSFEIIRLTSTYGLTSAGGGSVTLDPPVVITKSISAGVDPTQVLQVTNSANGSRVAFGNMGSSGAVAFTTNTPGLGYDNVNLWGDGNGLQTVINIPDSSGTNGYFDVRANNKRLLTLQNTNGVMHLGGIHTTNNIVADGTITANQFIGSGTGASEIHLYGSDGTTEVAAYTNGVLNVNGGGVTNVPGTNLVYRAIFNTNANNGVAIDASRMYQSFQTNADTTVTGFSGLVSGKQHIFSMCYSNSAGTTKVFTIGPASVRLIGSGSTNAMSLPSGKQGIASYWILPGVVTNAATSIEQ